MRITHSEYNPSPTARLRFLQIWIWPGTRGLTPSYAERAFPTNTKRQLIASPDGRDGSLLINQDATLERLKLVVSADAEALWFDLPWLVGETPAKPDRSSSPVAPQARPIGDWNHRRLKHDSQRNARSDELNTVWT